MNPPEGQFNDFKYFEEFVKPEMSVGEVFFNTIFNTSRTLLRNVRALVHLVLGIKAALKNKKVNYYMDQYDIKHTGDKIRV